MRGSRASPPRVQPESATYTHRYRSSSSQPLTSLISPIFLLKSTLKVKQIGASSQYRPSPLPGKEAVKNLTAQIHRPRRTQRPIACPWLEQGGKRVAARTGRAPCSSCFIRSRSGIAYSDNGNPAPARVPMPAYISCHYGNYMGCTADQVASGASGSCAEGGFQHTI
jgi:hypothetical protein